MGHFTPEEGVAYNFWLTVIVLIKIGLSYDTILQLSEDEIAYIIGVNSALEQREADEHARQERLAEQRQRTY